MEDIKKKQDKRFKIFIIMGVVVTFSLSFWLAANLDPNSAPDEYARFMLVEYMFKYGRLPIGDEEEIVMQIWGFSYAFRPYLFQIFSALFMKAASIFTSNEIALYTAARIPSVLCYAGTFVFASLISKETFKKFTTQMLFPVMLVFWPQIIFLSSYINNDITSLFSVTMIIYFWVLGYKKGWSMKNCLGLGIAVGLCTSSYYNAYGFVLCSIAIFIYIACKNKMSFKEILLKALFVFAVAFAIGGWYFVRNYFIWDGDIFGLRTEDRLWRENCMPQVAPDAVFNLKNSGLPIVDYLTKVTEASAYSWVSLTYYSLIGVFGYMSVIASSRYYAAFSLYLILGMLFYIIRFFKKDKKLFYNAIAIICVLIPVCLSVYFSCSSNFQPQGRYIITIVPMILLAVCKGYEYLYEIVQQKTTECKNAVLKKSSDIGVYIVIVTYLMITMYIIFKLLVRFCFYAV